MTAPAARAVLRSTDTPQQRADAIATLLSLWAEPPLFRETIRDVLAEYAALDAAARQ